MPIWHFLGIFISIIVRNVQSSLKTISIIYTHRWQKDAITHFHCCYCSPKMLPNNRYVTKPNEQLTRVYHLNSIYHVKMLAIHFSHCRAFPLHFFRILQKGKLIVGNCFTWNRHTHNEILAKQIVRSSESAADHFNCIHSCETNRIN